MATASSSSRIEFSYKDKLTHGMKKPHDVICHRGKYIVTNIGNHRVISIDPGDMSSEILCQDKDGLAHPCAPMEPYSIVALSENTDEFLFTDLKNGCILHLRPGGHPGHGGNCRKWSETLLRRPTGIAINKPGDKVFVADCGAYVHHIAVFDINGNHLRTFGAEDLSFPWFIAFNSKGYLYVADDFHGVKVFNPDGECVEDRPVKIKTENVRWICRGLAIDKYDNIFITKRTARSVRFFSYEKVIVFNRDHKPVDNFGGWFHFNFVRGVCFDYERSYLVIVDGERHQLQRYNICYTNPPPSIEPRLTTEVSVDDDT